MAKNKEFYVKIKNPTKLSLELLLEQLRYAGVISVEKNWPLQEKITAISIVCPRYVAADRRENWAQNQADRMRSFGIKTELVERK